MLGEAMTTAAHTPGVDIGPSESVGLCWMMRTLDGVDTIEHYGSTAGYFTLLRVLPSRRGGLAIVTNSTSAERWMCCATASSCWALKPP